MGATEYRVIERVHDGRHTIVDRAVRTSDDVAVYLKAVRGPYPLPTVVARFRRECALTKRLSSPAVVDVLSVEERELSDPPGC